MLEQLFEHSPLVGYLYLEQHVFSRDYGKVNFGDLRPEYQPQVGNILVNLRSMPIHNVRYFSSQKTRRQREIIDFYNKNFQIGFPLHPQDEDHGPTSLINLISKNQKRESLFVAMTASSRTFFSPTPKHHFLKTGFAGRISQSLRDLTCEHIERSLWVSNYLQTCIGSMPEGSGIFPEFFGACLNIGESSTGFLLRDFYAIRSDLQYSSPNNLYIPLFSLYAKERNHLNDQELLFEIAEIYGMHPFDFFTEVVVPSHIQDWRNHIYDLGVLSALHGQNSVYEFDRRERRIVGRYYRDFDHRGLLHHIIASRGIVAPLDLFPRLSREEERVYIGDSYDHMIGALLFDRFVEMFEEKGVATGSQTEEAIKDIFHSIVSSAERVYLPKKAISRTGIGITRRRILTLENPTYR